MADGVIAGGWGFVTAAYVITAVGLIGYALSLWRRHRSAGEREEQL